MKTIYPVVISRGESFYIASIPDLEIDTQGVDLVDAIEMARDAVGLWICHEQDNKKEIPSPSDLSAIQCGEGEIVTLVDIDIGAYRRKHDNRTVRKNLTIPSWLNEKAEEAGVNFSSVLQKALKEALQIAE